MGHGYHSRIGATPGPSSTRLYLKKEVRAVREADCNMANAICRRKSKPPRNSGPSKQDQSWRQAGPDSL
eukprot:4678121-Pleurochrysis_carterae.AAC.3